MSTKTISPVDLAKLIGSGNTAVIDVRTPVEFAEVHVEQAVNIPLDQLAPDSLIATGQAHRNQPVYILCRSGQRATKAADKLAAANFTAPIVVSGGTLAWIAAGLPVKRGSARVISLERQVRIAAGSIVFTGVILSKFVHPGFIWLSGFVGAGLVFAGITDFCGMGMLIAKLPWNRRVS
jgi:rhodanese-related sulfurtransferase